MKTAISGKIYFSKAWGVDSGEIGETGGVGVALGSHRTRTAKRSIIVSSRRSHVFQSPITVICSLAWIVVVSTLRRRALVSPRITKKKIKSMDVAIRRRVRIMPIFYHKTKMV